MSMTITMLPPVGRTNGTPTTTGLTSDSVSRASVATTEGFIGSETYRRVKICLLEKLISSNPKKEGGCEILHEKTRVPFIVLNQPIERKVARRESRPAGLILSRGPMTWAEIAFIRNLTPEGQAPGRWRLRSRQQGDGVLASEGSGDEN